MSHTVHQRFSIPVLVTPCSAHFVCLSYRFRRLFYSKVSALRSGHHRIFLVFFFNDLVIILYGYVGVHAYVQLYVCTCKFHAFLCKMMQMEFCLLTKKDKKKKTITFLCAFIVIAVVLTLLFFNIENDFQDYIFIIFIVIVLCVNGP